MPRPPTNHHVLRELRHILGLSQAQLAARIGVKPITLKKIENGSLNPSREVAIRIEGETMLSADQLLNRPSVGRPLAFNGLPVTRAMVEEYWRNQKATPMVFVTADAEILSFWLQALLDIAATHRKAVYNRAVAALRASIGNIASELGLESRISELALSLPNSPRPFLDNPRNDGLPDNHPGKQYEGPRFTRDNWDKIRRGLYSERDTKKLPRKKRL
jgi:transcriptional regulator with XRE-family HTH domain